MIQPEVECVPSVCKDLGLMGSAGLGEEHLPEKTVAEENISHCVVKSGSSR